MTESALPETAGQVLVVCTGNVCRSPFIEGMLRHGLPPSVKVRSAGTAALVGAPMDPRVLAHLRRHGAAPDAFAARQLSADMVRAADLVLTATRAHRAAVASMHPGALAYVFTLGDFRDLAQDVEVDELAPAPGPCWVAQVAKKVADRRGLVPPRGAEEVDVADPYGKADLVFSAMVGHVFEALPAVLRLLTASQHARG